MTNLLAQASSATSIQQVFGICCAGFGVAALQGILDNQEFSRRGHRNCGNYDAALASISQDMREQGKTRGEVISVDSLNRLVASGWKPT